MIERIEQTINKIDNLIKEQLPESKYQFELYDLATNTKHFRGLDEPFHWGSVYKLFIVAEIIKMIDEGELSEDYILKINNSKLGQGAGIFGNFKHINQLNIIDACKFVIAVSDALISDSLFKIVGVERINNALKTLKVEKSLITDDLDGIVKSILPDNFEYNNVNYLYSPEFYKNYESKLKILLLKNYTTASDVNVGLHNLLNHYYTNKYKEIFLEVIQMTNVWSRFTQYTFFNKNIILKGKTGYLGFGIVANETAIIIDKRTNTALGYFSVFTKDNTERIYNVFDVIGLVGLEVVKLYEELEINHHKK